MRSSKHIAPLSFLEPGTPPSARQLPKKKEGDPKAALCKYIRPSN
jgi:hypothetical protein